VKFVGLIVLLSEPFGCHGAIMGIISPWIFWKVRRWVSTVVLPPEMNLLAEEKGISVFDLTKGSHLLPKDFTPSDQRAQPDKYGEFKNVHIRLDNSIIAFLNHGF